MSERAKVGILLSVYNGMCYLGEQMESLLAQEGGHGITVYIRDDGSHDGSREYAEELARTDPERVKIVLSSGNLGPARSFWELLRQVDGMDYYAFADQDDVWDRDKIDTAVRAISGAAEQYGQACTADGGILWGSNYRVIDRDGNLVDERYHAKFPILTIVSQLICGCVPGCAMVFDSTLRDKLLGFPMETLPMHDIVVMTYALASGKVLYDDEPHISYRHHQGNMVAREGKDLIGRLKATYDTWHGQCGVYSAFARQILRDNKETLPADTRDMLRLMGNPGASFKDKIRLIRNAACTSTEKRALRSFRIRYLLGLY